MNFNKYGLLSIGYYPLGVCPIGFCPKPFSINPRNKQPVRRNYIVHTQCYSWVINHLNTPTTPFSRHAKFKIYSLTYVNHHFVFFFKVNSRTLFTFKVWGGYYPIITTIHSSYMSTIICLIKITLFVVILT